MAIEKKKEERKEAHLATGGSCYLSPHERVQRVGAPNIQATAEAIDKHQVGPTETE